jgi:hypothetical protein
MHLRNLFVPLLCLLLYAPVVARAADRGPSTPEERKQALQYIQDFEASPFSADAIREREWVIRWTIEIPDIHLHLCLNIGRYAKVDKKYFGDFFAAEILAQTAFLLQNPDKQDDRLAEYQAGVEGGLRYYEALLKANPKIRKPLMDELIQRRETGTLAQFVLEQSKAECNI